VSEGYGGICRTRSATPARFQIIALFESAFADRVNLRIIMRMVKFCRIRTEFALNFDGDYHGIKGFRSVGSGLRKRR
jgi:hypothetical protein